MARDEVGTQEVIKSILEDLKINNGYTCCIYPTAPLMTEYYLGLGLAPLVEETIFDYTFSVGINPLSDAGQFYWGEAESFLNERPLFSFNTAMIPISDNRVCDINTAEDWERAEKMYSELNG